jgi:hypothetical protein
VATLFEGVGLAELVGLLRKRFEDKRLYFTFLASSGGVRGEETDSRAGSSLVDIAGVFYLAMLTAMVQGV